MIKTFIFIFLLIVGSANAQIPSDSEKFVESISSVAKAKGKLKEAFLAFGNCTGGGCLETWSIQICEIVGAVDVQSGFRLTRSYEGSKGKVEKFHLEDSDLKLFKAVFQNCKPSAYQYWQHRTVLHLAYAGNEKAVRLALGMLGAM